MQTRGTVTFLQKPFSLTELSTSLQVRGPLLPGPPPGTFPTGKI